MKHKDHTIESAGSTLHFKVPIPETVQEFIDLCLRPPTKDEIRELHLTRPQVEVTSFKPVPIDRGTGVSFLGYIRLLIPGHHIRSRAEGYCSDVFEVLEDGSTRVSAGVSRRSNGELVVRMPSMRKAGDNYRFYDAILLTAEGTQEVQRQVTAYLKEKNIIMTEVVLSQEKIAELVAAHAQAVGVTITPKNVRFYGEAGEMVGPVHITELEARVTVEE